jgi:type II secretory pathway pseudopilin PulG
VRAPRLADEKGFGLIELLFALVMLNVGIFALMGTFQTGALAITRSATTSNGTAVADKVLEVYRGLQNKAIYLNAPTSGGSDVSGYPNGIPNSTSSWYARYQGDTAAYPGTAYYSYANPSSTPKWVTQSTTSSSSTTPIPTTDTTVVPTGLAITPTSAVQGVAGPDGQTYPVCIYIVMLQLSVSNSSGTVTTGGWVKQVTVVVRDPRHTSNVIARESALFDPTVAP